MVKRTAHNGFVAGSTPVRLIEILKQVLKNF